MVNKWTSRVVPIRRNQCWALFHAIFLLTLFFLPAAEAVTKRGLEKDIGVYFPVTAEPADQQAAFQKALAAAFREAYGRKVVELKVRDATPNELLFQAAISELDHVVMIEGKGGVKVVNQKKEVVEYSYQFDGKVQILDLSTLKEQPAQPVAVRGQEEAPLTGLPAVDAALMGLSRQIFQKMTAFYNPNIMGDVVQRKLADYFYERKDCARALPLLETAIRNESQFDIQAELEKRRDMCKRLVSTQSRLQASYRCDLTFQNMGAEYQKFYTQAFATLRLNEVFRQYSDKPVTIEVRYSGEQENAAPGEILLTMFHDARRFPVAAALKTAQPSGTLNFAPYKPVLVHLVRLHYTAMKSMTAQQRAVFGKFAMRVRLEKPNGDYLTYALALDRNSYPVAPKKFTLQVTGYKITEIEPANTSLSSPDLFPLGPSYNIDGKETVYHIVYQFFDVPSR